MLSYQSLGPGPILSIMSPFLLLALYKMRPYKSFKNQKSGRLELRLPTDYTRYPYLFMSRKKCHYTAKYFNYLDGKESKYTCQGYPLDSGLCIFHDEEYWEGHVEQVNLAFYNMLSKYIEENRPLVFIGFRPPLRLTSSLLSGHSQIDGTRQGLLFRRPVIFLDCNFELVAFSEGEFDFIDFSYSTFTQAYFEDAIFYKTARFTGCNFQSSRFTGAVFYQDTVFTNTRYLGGADFDFSRFDGNVDFSRCTFEAQPGFYGTEFVRKADFTKSRFSVDSQAHHFNVLAMLDSTTYSDDVITNNVSLIEDRATSHLASE